MRETGLSMEQYATPEREQTPEAMKEQIFERADQKELELFAKCLIPTGSGDENSEFWKKFPNFVPGVLAWKALSGREQGQKLDRRQRFIYGAAAATELAAIGLFASGNYEGAEIAKLASMSLSKGDSLLPVAKIMAGKLMKKYPRLAHIMEASGDWMMKSAERLKNVSEILKPSLEKLNLDGIEADE